MPAAGAERVAARHPIAAVDREPTAPFGENWPAMMAGSIAEHLGHRVVTEVGRKGRRRRIRHVRPADGSVRRGQFLEDGSAVTALTSPAAEHLRDHQVEQAALAQRFDHAGGHGAELLARLGLGLDERRQLAGLLDDRGVGGRDVAGLVNNGHSRDPPVVLESLRREPDHTLDARD